MPKFYFFVTKLELISLLKREVKSRFPFLTFSFAHQNILFYKKEEDKSNIEIAPLLASFFGPMYGKFPVNTPKIFEIPTGHIAFNVSLKDFIYSGSYDKKLFSLLNQNIEESPFSMPDLAPSRAYLKAWEYLQIISELGDPLEKDEEVIEIGCAPGGASFLFCERGAKVFGVDPGEVSKNLEQFSRSFYHHPIAMQKLKAKDWGIFLNNPRLLFCDVNLRPSETILYLKKILGDFKKGGGQYLVWTVKLTDWRNCEEFFLKEWPKIERELALFHPILTLKRVVPSHHKEFLLLVKFR